VRVAQYRFLTTWIFDAPIDEVWERLDDPLRRPGRDDGAVDERPRSRRAAGVRLGPRLDHAPRR
jgi:hypothetical protein